MDQAEDLLDQEQFTCAVCLDLLTDPVAIPCGHSYCMSCIDRCWDVDTKVYSCPQCRHTFASKPDLKKNTMLADLVEKMRKLGAAPSAGPGDVACDICTGEKRKAVRSCLVCLQSYCKTHLKPHNDSPPLMKHKLVQATGCLQEKICAHHSKMLEVYCRTDQQCICYLCMTDQHRGHDTVSVAVERIEKQKQLGATQKKFLQKIQEREKDLQILRQAVELLTGSAQESVEDSEGVLTALILSVEGERLDVTELIGDQETAAASRAEELVDGLEQEVAELKEREAELVELLDTDDHVHFLQGCQTFCAFPTPGGLLRTQDRSRKLFLQFSRRLTLDPNTVHKHLRLSEGDSEVAYAKDAQPHPDHPERFDCWEQVLCREGLSGRCYWEAEWSGEAVYFAMAYKEMGRKGGSYACGLGYNDKSWSLRCSPSSLYFWHNNKSTKVPVPPSSRIGVYLDHSAGTLSFYSISGTMTLLHRVQTTFTQPLYPAFWVYKSSVKLCRLE